MCIYILYYTQYGGFLKYTVSIQVPHFPRLFPSQLHLRGENFGHRMCGGSHLIRSPCLVEVKGTPWENHGKNHGKPWEKPWKKRETMV